VSAPTATSSATKRRPATHLRARLGAVASALEALVGEPSTLTTGDVPADRAAALEALPPKVYKAETLVTHGDEPRVGFLLPHDAVIAIGASMLMIPDPPPVVTEDIAAGFEEAFNIAVGAWNDGAKPTLRWGSAVEHRKVGDTTLEEVEAWLTGGDIELLPLNLTLGEARFRIFLFGPPRLLFKEQADAFALSQVEGTPGDGGPPGPEVGQAVDVAATPEAQQPGAGSEPGAPAGDREEPIAPAAAALSTQADAGSAPAAAAALSSQADAGGAPAAPAQAVHAQADAGGTPAAPAQAIHAQPDGAPVAPGPPPSRSPAAPASSRPNAPPPGVVAPGASSPDDAGLGAEILLVDPEGVLRAFIVSKIRSGEIRVYRGAGRPPALGPTASAILIRPTPETVAAVRADRTVIVRGAHTRVAEPDARADVEIAAA